MKEKILVTGGNGFVGRNLIKYLSTEFEVHVLDKTTQKKSTDTQTYFKMDMYNVDKLEPIYDYIINLAAQTSVQESIKDPQDDLYNNIECLMKLLKFAKKCDVKKFIQISSGAAVQAKSPYGVSKLCGEHYCKVFKIYDVNCNVLRISNVYGPYSEDKESFIAKSILCMNRNQPIEIYGDGTQTRDFIYVDDVCKAIHLSLFIDSDEVIPICTGKTTSVNDIVKLFNYDKITYSPKKPGEIMHVKSETSQLILEPKVDIKSGIKNTLEWFDGQR